MLLPLLVACSEYELTQPADHPGGEDPRPPRTDRDIPADHLDTGSPLVDTGGAPPRGDTGQAPPGDSGAPDWQGCSDGYWADFYNLPADHPDVEGDVTGVVTGDLPTNHDWYDARWFVRRELQPSLEYGDDWWPVDEGLAGDPQYFAVHFHAFLDVTADTVGVFELGSDDDGWAFVDGTLVADLGGIHAVSETQFPVALAAGTHELDLYMAERHTSQSGFWFKWDTDGIDVWACP